LPAAQGFLAAHGFFLLAAAQGLRFLGAHGFAAHGFFCASCTRVALRGEHGFAAASGAPSMSPDESTPATTGQSLDLITSSCK